MKPVLFIDPNIVPPATAKEIKVKLESEGYLVCFAPSAAVTYILPPQEPAPAF